MKGGFYPKLAWTGIRKNKKLYIPYVLTCVGMVMMFYIVAFLSCSDMIRGLSGGATIQWMLEFGVGVIGVFALIFLFYTNSFLTRRRKKEFGLYNILGMGKRNLGVIQIWESLIIAGIALGVGLLCGIGLSKFAELLLVNILRTEADYSFRFEPQAVIDTLKWFAVIFGLILLNNLRQLHVSNPIELMRSEHTGEKPPKANWLMALLGAVILAVAYYMALTIKQPLEAFTMFFIAVILVIIATYLLFIAGSVSICRILQKNKSYYYKSSHFVSLSSMVYRMKRNGAGLASICILCTMVLVMMSAVVGLYVGVEDSLRVSFRRNIYVDTVAVSPEALQDDTAERLRALANEATREKGVSAENILDYQCAAAGGYLTDGQFAPASIDSYNFDLAQIVVASLEDYNRLTNRNETLEAGEALISVYQQDYTRETISIEGGQTLKIKGKVSDFDDYVITTELFPTIYIFVPDVQAAIGTAKDASAWEYHWFYGFDTDCSDEVQLEILTQISEGAEQLFADHEALEANCDAVATGRNSYYGLYGGLFFLAILLGVIFVFATVLIMYYKQISEGYEDQSRFEIMRKVGMTRRDIKKSINSQILTVFFLPLLAAGVHLIFAFPMICKLLVMFNLTNMKLLRFVTLLGFLIFALFYILMYCITSREYYAIVSGIRDEKA